MLESWLPENLNVVDCVQLRRVLCHVPCRIALTTMAALANGADVQANQSRKTAMLSLLLLDPGRAAALYKWYVLVHVPPAMIAKNT